MTTAALGLGSSLGDRQLWLRFALARLAVTPGIRVEKVSRCVVTPPLKGSTATGWFLNAAVRLQTALTADSLLRVCVDLEQRAGRRRSSRWADRTLDVDLLAYGDVIARLPGLTLPHPAIRARPFVVQPLGEVWPEGVDPESGETWYFVAKASLQRPGVGRRPPRRVRPPR